MLKDMILPLILVLFSIHISSAQASIPAKYDGFPYENGGDRESIMVDAFFDPLCPDSRDAWPPLKRALQDYSPHVSLILHPFPLPYHDNSYISCRALHIANKLNASTTYPLLELFFENQGEFGNAATMDMSRASIIEDMAKFAVKAVGNSFLPAFQSGFSDRRTDISTRISFKYGCSRGVTGTPYFFVNGFALPGAGSALDYETWRSIIDPLLEKQQEGLGEPLLYF